METMIDIAGWRLGFWT